MLDVTDKIGALSAERRLLLELLRRRRGLGTSQDQTRPAAPPEDGGAFSLLSAADCAVLPPGLEDAYPLASMQLGMLYHTELTRDDEVPAYHNVFLFDIDSAIVPGVFEAAVQRVVARHPILRTSFDLRRFSEPLQLVYRTAFLPVPCIDLSSLDDVGRERELQCFLLLERRRVLDPSRPPLLRFFLHRLGESRFRVTMTESHAIAEGWVTYQTLGEIQEVYLALLSGQEVPEPKSSAVTYREFIRLEREALASEEHRRFWAEKLAGGHLVRAPRWPGSPGEAAGGERTHIFRMPEPVLAGLRDLSRRLEMPFKSVILATHLKVLSLVSGERDLVVALHVHGRPEEVGGEYVRGVFNNTVPLRVDLGSGSWADLIRRVFTAELEAIPFQRYPAAAIQRDTGKMSQLEVQVGYVNFHLFGEVRTLSQVTVPSSVDRSLSHYPLTLYFWGSGRGPAVVDLRFESFDPGITRAQVLALRGYYEEILRAMIEAPGSMHHARSWLSAAERHQVLREFNDTAAGFSGEVRLHRAIERQAARTPDAVAVFCMGSALSYGELDARAGRLARLLRRLGVGPDVVVGVCAERSVELMVGLLGILKAGGTYLPLDPSYPPERLALMVEDGLAGCGRPVLLVQSHLAPLFAGWGTRVGIRQVELERPWEPGGKEAADDGGDEVEAENLAYIIYTSGSTGQPKGAMVAHAGMLNHLQAKVMDLGLDEHSRVAQTASLCFDISVWQLLAPLLAGGSVHIASESTVHDPGLLLRFVAREGMTVLEVVPSLLSGIVESLAAAGGTINLSSLQWMIVTGEACPQSLADRWLTLAPHTRLLNAYGPTECSDDVTHYRRVSPGAGLSPSLPIGKPVANTRLYVVDPQGFPTPQGVAGEICVSGRGVGRGYLDLPERTAKVFIPDPWSGEPGSRLYRTGDLGRWLPDGTLDFLGRTDHQVKLRGFRIELGEIEAVLARHPAVREAVAVAREERPGDVRLVAYAVPARNPWPEVSDLRSWMAERLPDFMVPSAFVLLAALPMTPNGKVDRRALPAPVWAGREEAEHQAPRGPIEEMVAGIWEEVLGLPRVSARDNFFDLGGHSLLAMQVVSRVRGAFEVELPLGDLFTSPTVEELARRVEEIRQGVAKVVAPPILRVPRHGDVPLSFAQERLWFIDQLEPGSAAYNVPLPARIEGQPDVAALRLTLAEIVRRHEVLRTRYESVGGRPTQVIGATADGEVLPVVDLGALREGTREEEVRRLAASAAEQPFDLGRGPVFRAVLVRLAEEEHHLLATLHHIVCDEASAEVLLQEMSTLYAAYAAGRPSPLAELPIQYADYAAWQRRWLDGEKLSVELSYWREILGGEPPVLELPTDRPRPAVQTHHGATRASHLPVELGAALGRLGRRQGATLFMTLLAVFVGLLRRYTGQQDICVGTPVSGRHRVELEGLIGFFLNTLVIRVERAGDPRFTDLLAAVRERSLQAFAHQDLPFEKLVDELQPRRSLSYSPLFQALFVLVHTTAPAALPGRWRWQPVEVRTAKFDLTLTVHAGEQGLSVSVEYNTDLFDGATIGRMFEHFGRLAAGAAEHPEGRLAALPMLSAAERQQLLAEHNDTAAAFAGEGGVHRLFEAQAERTPEAVAVVFEGEGVSLSYGELDWRSSRLAHRLRGLGVGPEVQVGLQLERSPELLVGLLGILKAGGAYVPIDPVYPRPRRELMLSDAGVSVLVTRESLAGDLVGSFARVYMERGAEPPGRQSAPSPGVAMAGSNLAYVIYTSGSTGRPKGVSLPHGALSNLIEWHLATLSTGVRTLQFASVSFDVSFYEMFACWGSGGTLYLVSEELRRDMAGLAGFLVSAGIEKAILPVVVLQQLAEEYGRGLELPPLREVTTTGEQLQTTRAMARLFERLGGCEFHNHYGPSESHVVTAYRLGEEPGGWLTHPSIGRPVANCDVHLLDRELEPVPLGMAGELCIGGVCLARGYLGRPELTAERFIPHPWSGGRGERLYRTGDKVRRLVDGTLDFLGRFDHQVKVRGFRVELEEIESVLGRHPEVLQTVVLAREVGPGDRRLVAYVVAAGPGTRTREWREYLQERLPEYMVPAWFVELPSLPLTPNGKVDRRALPEPEVAVGQEEGSVAPRNPIESLLAGIWEDVLGWEGVGVEDDFFDLGGHSLLATQVVSRARQVFQVELPVRRLFESPTVAGLARAVKEARQGEARPAVPPLVRAVRSGHLRLSFAQQRLWFLNQLEPDAPAYNMPTALRIGGRLDVLSLRRAAEEVTRRHEVLRTVFQEVGGEPVQVIAERASCPFLLVDLGALPATHRESELLRLADGEARRPFDLQRGPLLRTVLAHLAPEEHALLATMHHIVSDGWSLGLFSREISTLYAAFSASEPSPLPELAIQYADFAVWQRGWLSGQVLEQEIAHWRLRLEGVPAVLDLPLDRPRPAVQSIRGGGRRRSLPLALTEALRGLSRKAGATLFMSGLAAFQAVLSRWSGQSDICVGTPIANRNTIETEPLIGFFVNTLVLRAGLAGDPGLSALIGQVRDAALDAYAHQDVPFERLVEELRPERSLSHSPLFQVLFGLRTMEAGPLEIPGLHLAPLTGGTGVMIKFDLELELAEAGGGLAASLGYSTALFDATTAERLLSHFESFLRQAVEQPERPVAELSLLSDGEWQQVVVEWNDLARTAQGGEPLEERFAAQARRHPDRVAVVGGSHHLSYGGLDEASERLAGRLRVLDVGPEVPVGLCVGREPELLVAMLGILRAGGAYVPLDSSYPRERLAWLLADSGASVVVTQERLRDLLPEAGPRAVLVDDPRFAGAHAGPALTAGPKSLAYLIYTSGSTGKPKAVAIERCSVSALVSWAEEVFSPAELSGVLAATSIAFDLSVFELMVPLSLGGRVLLAQSVLDLPDLAGREQVSLVNTVPSVMAELLRQRGLHPSVETVNLAGEPLSQELVRAVHAAHGGRVLNLYGPSEDTTYSTWALQDPQAEREVGIGRPIAGTRALVLDAGLRPVPAGVTGELCLGGAGLARGYYRRPELTAERFVPDPLAGSAAESGARLYRTGDRVRQRAGGGLEFLGRLDQQVKLRGVRIEPGEVEAALLSHPAVHQAVVVVREDAPGERRLVGYVVAREELPVGEALREWLLARLPQALVPSVVMVLDRLPLTPNGKLDRRALPAPHADASAAVLAPRTPMEELLAGIWAEVLGLEQVGVRDDFFALGGHSLLATRVISRVRTLFGAELPVRALFELPTVEGLARVVKEAQQGEARPAAPPLLRAARGGYPPLSFAQQRLWFLNQLEPGAPAYNMPTALRIGGPLDVLSLRRAIEEVVRRHEVLRTTFQEVGSEPAQVIAERASCPFLLTDLGALPASHREPELLRLAGGEARRPFDLQRGPLLRTVLARLGLEDHVLLTTMHHIVSDGWSLGLFSREISTLYAAFSAGEPSPLPELAIQYADFAMWQRGWLSGQVLEQEIAHWRLRLEGVPTVLDLPLDRPRPPVQSFRGGGRRRMLSLALAGALRGVSRRAGATLFMTGLAAFQALLSRWSGQSDICVGTPIANRNTVETEPLIGFFVNTLVLRAGLASDPGLDALIGQVREVALEAYAHQDVPFERLVEELQPERSLSHSPLFQVLFGLRTTEAGPLEIPGLHLAPLMGGTGVMVKFDIELELAEAGGGLAAALGYSTALFDATTAERLLSHFESFLLQAAEQPERPVAELPLLSDGEWQQVVVEWNDLARTAQGGEPLEERFAAQARRHPDQVAVVGGSCHLSYEALAAASGRLAGRLRALGVGPEVPVGLCIGRQPELVVAMLGILRAGGAYVPLDPSYPGERLAWLLADSGARVIVTEERLRERLPAEGRSTVLMDDPDGPGLYAEPADPAEPESLAYLIYTSGSTGRPKAVAIERRSVSALVSWAEEVFSPAELSGVLAATSIAFDLSVFELMVPLSLGGRVLLAQSVLDLPDLAGREQVSLVNTVPSVMAELLRQRGLPPSVETVNLAGEPLSQELVRAVHAVHGGRVLNLYGPSEDTTYSTWALQDPRAEREVGIGRPIAGTRALVLDAGLRPVPAGVTGELCLGGAGLARGYYRRPELTAERFVPDPLAERAAEPGARLYRTGDRVRQRADGGLEFLGRLDQQVKLRGVRIEPGEVEAALLSHPAVHQAVVVVREDAPGERRLVGYVVAREELPVGEALREWLLARLPQALVPSVVMVLDRLPLTPNGKLDRRALPAPHADASAAVLAPRTPMEELLAGIWAEVLGLEQVGVRDDFFALGGHSLLATRVVSRVRTLFGAELPVRALFESPTVEELARRVAREKGAAPPSPILATPRRGALPLSFAQRRLWLLDRLEPGTSAYNMPTALRIGGPLEASCLEHAVRAMVRRHEVLRTTFHEADGEPVQVVGAEAACPFLRVDLSGLDGAAKEPELRRLAGEEAGRPFDLERGPLLRLVLARLAADEHALLLTMHHIVSDGWSLGLFSREISTLYAAFAAGRPSPLPDLPIQYADYAVWQRTRLSGELLATQLAWWKRELCDLPPPLDLPMARPRPRSHRPRRAGRQPLLLSRTMTEALRGLCRREGATLFMALLAGLDALLARYTGRTDLLVGLPVAGRDRLETEGLIGCFLNTLVIRADLGGDPAWLALLAQIREASLEAYARQDLPFEQLLDELQPERDLGRTPVFQVFFNMLSFGPASPSGAAGQQIRSFTAGATNPKLDLTVFATEGPEGVQLSLDYDADLFDAPQMARMAAHLEALLAAVGADPRLRLSEIQLERLPFPPGPPSVAGPFPASALAGSIGDRFAAVTREHAGRPAVLGAGEVWTYERLERVSRRIAAAIVDAVGPQPAPLALLLDQGIDRILGMIAAVRAGKTYVPLDPADPDDRIAFILHDSGAVAVLADEASRGRAGALADGSLRVLPLGAVAGTGGEDAGDPAPLLPAVPPESLAYVLYTSGSTGRPKGVVQSHRNVLHHARAYANALRIAPDDRLTLLGSYCFDAAVMDIFGALLSGAALCPYDVRTEGVTHLARWIEEQSITVYHSTPTLFRLFLDTLDERDPAASRRLPGLRHVVLGGERAERRDFERCRRRFPGAVLVNGLGPTESTLGLQFFAGPEVEPGDIAGPGIPAGLPVEATAVSLWNAAGEQVAVWGVGEIVLRSDHLAVCYLRRPDLTAAAFIPDPAQPGGRAYRTGDLGRRLPDGSLEFVGRADFQVKIRGHRVEPGEVEAALAAVPGVRGAVVVPQQGAHGETVLTAFLLAPEGEAPAAAELRQLLRRRLPEFMIPVAFALLTAWPLTPTGKIDRSTLPAQPDLSGEEASRDEAAGPQPQNPLVELLCDLWAEVLGRQAVGAREDFFQLGGHSLLATQLLSRVERRLGFEVALRTLFEAPTPTLLAEQIEILLRGDTGTLRPPLVPVPRRGLLPLSFAQQRLWFLDRLQPGNPAYNMPLAIRLLGGLDQRALLASLSEIVRRHEVLRSRFAEIAGEPVQIVAASLPVPLPVVDHSALPTATAAAEVLRLTREEAATPFDLGRGPLLRATLLERSGSEHVVLFTLHHIVSDGWSMGVLAREVMALYEAFHRGSPSPLAELPIQYADYADWQHHWLRSGGLDAGLAYWQERLLGASGRLDLPADRPRPKVPSLRGGARTVALPSGLAAVLRSRAREEGSTLFMLLLAAYQTLFHRLTGAEDVTVGTPIAGRSRYELEGLLGLFVNTLVMRGDLSGDVSFRDLLGRTREAALEAHAFQDVPFEKVVEALQPERDLASSPLFQVFFTLQNQAREEMRLPGLEVSTLGIPTGSAKFDLSLTLAEGPRGITGTLEYAADLFDVTTASRFAQHFETLVAAAVEEPDVPLSALGWLRAEERHQLLVEWADTEVSSPREGLCLHEAVMAGASLLPDAVAVIGPEGARLTYGELAARSGGLAARLTAEGVGPGRFVPLLLESGLELVVALLGVLRAGGAFVPLDPSWPEGRIEAVLDALGVLGGPEVLLVAGAGPVRVKAPWRPLPVGAGSGRGTPSAQAVRSTPLDPVYAIYTSGSTGRPKGVVVPHEGIVNRFLWMDRFFGSAAAASVLQTTRPVYDSAVWQILWPLTHGGTTVLTSAQQAANASELAALIAGHRITLADFVPALFDLFVERMAQGEGPAAASLQAVVVGGEEMKPSTARTFAALISGVKLANLYGPTEASIGCIAHVIVGGTAGRVPIGRPISNTRVRILDRHGMPLPVGVPGELWLGGRCLGLGYIGAGETTGQAFVPAPSPSLPGERLYRTGDLARWLPDGRLDFLGRIDRQVKIRGVRIEPGEVEAVLAKHPGVGQGLVLTQAGPKAGDLQLVACVVPRPGAALTREDLRAFLRDRLPLALVPTGFAILAALPLTPGGKVDRAALERQLAAKGVDTTGTPGAAEAGAAEPSGPRTPYEEILAGIWAEVLRLDTGRSPVRVDDDFFALGGHSLLATQLVARIRSIVGVELPIRTVFEAPTLSALARRVAEATRSAVREEMPPLLPVGRAGELPLSFAQQRLWFLDQLLPGSGLYKIFIALRCEGLSSPGALAGALSGVVRRHEALRTAFPSVDGRPVQVIAPPGLLPLPVVDLGALPEAERRQEAREVARAAAHLRFDLGTGPLLRCWLLRLADEESVILLNVHHTVCDGWSINLLVQEVTALYREQVEGVAAELPELPVQYADYAVWQRRWLSGETLEREIEHWRSRLAEMPAVVELPTDRPRPAVQSPHGARRPLSLPLGLASALVELGRSEGSTLFMVLLAGLDAQLFRYGGQTRIAVGTPVANRGLLELENLIGNFANTLVLPVEVGAELTFRELLARAREAALGAYAHQDVPFELLVEALNPRRDLSYNPLFQVLLALHNLPRRERAAEGLSLQRLPVEGETARFDLALELTELPGGLQGALEYATDLFDTTTAERLARHFATLLASVSADPDRRVGDLPLLTEAERHQMLVEWNDSSSDGLARDCLHERFAMWARQQADAVALVFSEERVTYGELDCRAERLARRLRRLGVGPEVPVGLYMERSVHLVEGVLGILKAGGAYVPLDPSYPRPRLSSILAQTRVPVVVTHAALAASLPDPRGTVVCLDEQSAEADPKQAVVEVGPRTEGRNLSYVIFTSGSTGRPKGVAVPHAGAVHLVERARDLVGFGEEDVWTMVHSFAFDFSVWEIWGALSQGGRLVVVPLEVTQSPQRLAELVRREGVTVLNQTPSAARALAAEVGPGGLPSLRRLICGGEAFGLDLAGELLGWGVPLWAFYGPTESTVWAAAGPVREARGGAGAVALGKPLADHRVHVLDARLEPLPVGASGELHIVGPGLARGYFGDPVLTAQRFVPDPSGDRGERLYRTGDLVRRRLDGEIDFLGRIDQQVKIRGFRIELGEIESVLTEHAGVREAAVTVVDGAGGERALAAWIVPVGEDVAVEPIRRHAASLLPVYMVPAAFSLLPELPRTANGKLDRRALAGRGLKHGAGTSGMPPRDLLELGLVRIWEDLLGRPVGVTDSFFDLGGHSMLAVRLMSRLRTELARDLPISALFQLQTVEKLAAALRERTEPVRSIVAELSPGSPGLPLFLVHPVGGNVFSYVELARHLGADRPVYGLQAPGPEEDRALVTIGAKAERYLEEVRAIQPQGPYLLGGWSMGGTVALEMARRLRAAGEEVALLALLDPALPSTGAAEDVAEEDLALRFARDLAGIAGVRLEDPGDAQGEGGGLLRLFESGRAAGLLPPDIGFQSLSAHFESFCRSLRALASYGLKPWSGPLTLVTAARGADAPTDPAAVWASERAGVETHVLTGDHYALLRRPEVERVASILRSALQRAEGKGLPGGVAQFREYNAERLSGSGLDTARGGKR